MRTFVEEQKKQEKNTIKHYFEFKGQIVACEAQVQ